MPPLFSKVKPRTLRDEVADELRKAIVTGGLKPGQHLKETDIADQMSVSRSPVREAFRQLEQEGLIVSIPNQGSFVQVFDEKDIEEIFTLRSVLEDLACELIVDKDRLREEDFQRLEASIERQREAAEARDFDRLTDLDMAFHEFLCRKSGSERLLKMWQGLRAQIQVLFYERFRAFEWVPETVDRDHSAILVALREGDVERVSQINNEINTRVARECQDMLRAINEKYAL
jgi:DNA-binding GntR family transcriptional regulator